MNVEVPEFLLEMSRQMNEQPNRGTANPFWQVRCKRQISCCDGREDYWRIVDTASEYHEIYSTKSCDESYFFEYMREHYSDWVGDWEIDNDSQFGIGSFDIEIECQYLPMDYDELEKIPMQEIEEVVSTHLTQSDAERFIERKQHDYPRLYTYVESAYWSPQLKQLQDWIKELEK